MGGSAPFPRPVLWLPLKLRVALGFAESGFPVAQNAGYAWVI